MTGFDIFALLVVGLAAIGGLSRGFVQEALSLTAWAVAIIVIRWFHTDLTQWLVEPIGSASGAAVLAFAVLLLVPYIGLRLIAARAGQTSRKSVLGPFDRVLGLGFGALKGFVIVIMAFSMLVLGYDTIWGVGGRPMWLTEARTYPLVNASADWMVNLIREQRALLDGVEDPAPETAQ
jgi:membrane protein required for colicin V production